MMRSLAAAGLLLGAVAGSASAQQPIPLFPDAAPPRSVQPEPLPPLPPAAPDVTGARPAPPLYGPPPYEPRPEMPAPETPPAASATAPAGPAETRDFCSQPVGYNLARRDSVPPQYRDFIGIWSDASWTPQLCAALIVENVQPDGTASILYVFGPMSSSARQAGGILRGTGVIRDGELRFQNSDGSQFAFRPLYADMDGRLTTPKGQSYQAVFKKTL